MSESHTKDTESERLTKEAVRNRRMVSHRFFFGYAYDQFTHTPLYSHWQNLLSLIRRFRTVAFLLRMLTVIVTVVETGALVLLTTALFLVILPLGAALMLGILLTALLESRRSNRLLRTQVTGKRVYVLFLHTAENAFLWQNAKSLANDGNTVIVVSPYWISSKGLQKGNFYATFRRESKGIYLIRRYYFFSLRKHVLKDADTAFLY